MKLIQELTHLFQRNKKNPELYCKVFEDNRSAIAIAESKKFTPRKKHIALKYHHFKNICS